MQVYRQVRHALLGEMDYEREGAAAWRGIGAAHSSAATREELEAIADLEEENAAFLESLFV